VSYHDFYGVLVDRAERETIIKNLGNNHVRTQFHTRSLYIAVGWRDDIKSSPERSRNASTLSFIPVFFFFLCVQFRLCFCVITA
jgi:hypothetical protein